MLYLFLLLGFGFLLQSITPINKEQYYEKKEYNPNYVNNIKAVKKKG
jgi:hypothetical protein